MNIDPFSLDSDIEFLQQFVLHLSIENDLSASQDVTAIEISICMNLKTFGNKS